MSGLVPGWGQTPPWADTPQGRHPPGQTPPWADTPREDTPWQTPPRDTLHPPPLRSSRLWNMVSDWPVRILLECILVSIGVCLSTRGVGMSRPRSLPGGGYIWYIPVHFPASTITGRYTSWKVHYWCKHLVLATKAGGTHLTGMLSCFK